MQIAHERPPLAGRSGRIRPVEGLPSQLDTIVSAFAADGAVPIRGLFSEGDLSWLARAVDACLADPSPLARQFAPPGRGAYHSDMYLSVHQEAFRGFRAGTIGSLAAVLLRSRTATLFNDELLVKEQRTDRETPWHHDLPYWPLDGSRVCSIWVPLSRVTRDSGSLEFLRGSHRVARRFHPRDFDTGADRVTSPEERPVDAGEIDPADTGCWTLDPGDCVVFHGLTLHRAAGNAGAFRRAAVVFRVVGDDVTWAPRPQTIPMPWAPRLSAGDPLDRDPDLFPRLWPPL